MLYFFPFHVMTGIESDVEFSLHNLDQDTHCFTVYYLVTFGTTVIYNIPLLNIQSYFKEYK